MVAAAFAGVTGERQERNAVYSSYSPLVGQPLAYAASPYQYSAYSAVPTAYAGYPYGGAYGGVYGGASVYSGLPSVRYY